MTPTEIAALEDALKEMEEFEWDEMGCMVNIANRDYPKCTCNASCCELCMALNTKDKAEKYLPDIRKAAQSYLDGQKERHSQSVAALNLFRKFYDPASVTLPREEFEKICAALDLVDTKSSCNFRLKAPNYLIDQLDEALALAKPYRRVRNP